MCELIIIKLENLWDLVVVEFLILCVWYCRYEFLKIKKFGRKWVFVDKF